MIDNKTDSSRASQIDEVKNTAIITVQDLSKSVISKDLESGEKLDILQSLSFSVWTGESIAITGPSGSGKSTLLGLLAGLDSPTFGAVNIEGNSIFTLSEDERAKIRAQTIGFVFQSFQLLPALTALENVMLPMEINNTDDAFSCARDVLQRVGLEHRLSHYPNQLSGGEQQRVAIARAFAPRPKILLADEPTGNLDSNTGKQIIDLLFELNREQQTTLILVTHDSELAQKCERRLQLDGGQLV